MVREITMETTKEVRQTASSVSMEVGSHCGNGQCNVDAENRLGCYNDEGGLDNAAREEKTTQDPNIVDWDGPNDPANPLNWPRAKKIAALGIVSLIALLS
jgi:hypothetical protein